MPIPHSRCCPSAPEGIPKISPLEASKQYLLHLRSAWNAAHPEAPLENAIGTDHCSCFVRCRCARSHTTAAKHAGYGEVIIMEEPQAAFYAWIERNPNWREQVKPGDLILVVDIGGGTTDFTLIAVTDEPGNCSLSVSLSVSTCCLAATIWISPSARHAEQQFSAKNIKLDAMQFHALWQQCRAAKEVLLSGDKDAPEDRPSRFWAAAPVWSGGTLRGKIGRDEFRTLLLEGFFPVSLRCCATTAAPRRFDGSRPELCGRSRSHQAPGAVSASSGVRALVQTHSPVRLICCSTEACCRQAQSSSESLKC